MKVPNALSRDDTEHGKYYYLASEADKIIDELRAELAALKPLADVGEEMVKITTTVREPDEWDAIPALWLMCMEERDKAKAELAAIKGQEPVAFDVMCEGCGGDGFDSKDSNYFCSTCGGSGFVEKNLYLAAGAQAPGYQLVPVEPTPEMLQALWAYKDKSLHGSYKAMLAAAKEQS